MPRTFKSYVPTVLTLSKEQLAKVPKGLKVRYGINRAKQKNGDIYVMERAYYIVPETNNPRAIASVKIGTIPKEGGDMIPVNQKKSTSVSTVAKLAKKAQSILADERQKAKVRFPLHIFWTVYILCALTGRTDATSVADYWNSKRKELQRYLPEMPLYEISPDSVLRLMSLLNFEQSKELAKLFVKTVELDPQTPRVVCIDGQAIRASRNEADRCSFTLNLFDSSSEQTLGQCLIEAKSSEVSGADFLLRQFDLDGTIVTADALFAKASMLELIIERGADYCIPVKDNTRVVKAAIDDIFDRSMLARDGDKMPEMKSVFYETELDHGRIEKRELYVLPSRLLPEPIKQKWPGLDEGCIVQYCRHVINKKTSEVSTQVKRLVSSVRWNDNVENILGTVIRRHWSIENNLHWVLDVAFRQDRIQCKNAKYIYARSWVNKMALNLLRTYQRKAGSTKSIEREMVEMHNLKMALKCLKMTLE